MATVKDWKQYPNFSKKEFDCKSTGENNMQEEFISLLQKLRTAFGFAMPISSGFRSARHPIEAKKASPGAHASGLACDVAVYGERAYRLVALALELGFTGVGIQQKGSGRFVHLDLLPNTAKAPRPTIWSY